MTTSLDDQLNATVSIPVHLLQYIDQECIRRNYDQDAADAFNAAFDAAFPYGPPGGCGGPIDMDEPLPRPRRLELGEHAEVLYRERHHLDPDIADLLRQAIDCTDRYNEVNDGVWSSDDDTCDQCPADDGQQHD
jgi:hypothetical protein